MRLTVLIENTSPPELIHEHGLSLHLEYEGRQYLLDAGSTGKMIANAAALHIDLSQVVAAILSHGHYDHADGLSAFFSVNHTALAYARPAVRQPDYTERQDGTQAYIGVNPLIFEQYGSRFDLDDGPRCLAPGLWLVPDAVAHEQSLVVESSLGLIVINSCCHAGAGYIVKDVLAQFPGRQVYALVGGFHLMGKTGTKSLGVAPGIVRNLSHWLCDELGVQQVYTGHCTGLPAYSLLEEELGQRLHPLRTGDIIQF